MTAQQYVVIDLNVFSLERRANKEMIEIRVVIDDTIILLTYQKIQIIVHVVEQPTDHSSQMDHFVWPVFLEQLFRRL